MLCNALIHKFIHVYVHICTFVIKAAGHSFFLRQIRTFSPQVMSFFFTEKVIFLLEGSQSCLHRADPYIYMCTLCSMILDVGKYVAFMPYGFD